MDTNETLKIKVYYDGLCHLCSREIEHYRKMKGAENILFVDITAIDFDSQQEGLDPLEIHKSLHVKDRAGQLHLGVDAFKCIWKEIPSMHFMLKIASTTPFYQSMKLLYSIFAKLRPLLPQKSCENSPYCTRPSHES